MHRFENLLITVYYHYRRTTTLHTITRYHTYQPVIGIGVDKAFDIKQVAEHRVGQHEYPFHNHNVTRFNCNCFLLTRAGKIRIGRHFDGLALFQLFELLHKKRPFDSRWLVEIDFRAFFDGHMTGILIIIILRKHCHFAGGETVNNLVYDSSFTGAGTSGDTYNQHILDIIVLCYIKNGDIRKSKYTHSHKITTFFRHFSQYSIKNT